MATILDTVLYTIAPADLSDVADAVGLKIDAAQLVSGAIRGAFIRSTGREAFYPSIEAAKAAMIKGNEAEVQFVKVTFESVGTGETIQ